MAPTKRPRQRGAVRMRNAPFCFSALCAAALVFATILPGAALTTDQVTSTTRAFVEWAFGFKLDPASVQSIHDGTVIDMSSDPAGVQTAVKDMNTTMTWLKSHTPQDSQMLRSLIEPELVAAWQHDTGASSGTSKALFATWEKHKHILADGTPPLRESVVNSYIALYEFIAKQTGKPVPAAIANHAQFRKQVAAEYSAASPDMQMRFNKVQTLWLAVHNIWQSATPAQQAAMRKEWRNPSSGAHAAAAAPQPQHGGFSGQTWNEEQYKEHLFVEGESEVMMSSWSNPF